ncbi:MAG: sugar ABC transporter substrate-binding protein [Rhodospirillales bacterium]|nr:sugar ABC transporter substrate-binding protein [Rhodospirillales bacterium]
MTGLLASSRPIWRPTRRQMLLTSGVGAAALAAGRPGRLLAQDKVTAVNSIRSLSNPYHATWNKGGEAFAQSAGIDYSVLVTEGNSEKGMADIKAAIAKTGGNMVLNVDPNDSPDARRIVEACVESKVYVVTQWNKPADLHPWDFDPYYVAHISFDGKPNGKAMAKALFEAIGGEGGICGLGGILSNVPAIERKQGLDEALAEFPNIKLLDFQVANWEQNTAHDIAQAWLTRFGDELKGIWAANDGMGIGALEALRAEGLAGQVPVTGIDGIQLAVEAVMNGEFAGTVAWDPFWQGGMGLSIAHHAKTGAFDPATEPKEHREFYGKGIVITKDNAQEFYDTNIKATPTLDFDDIWGRVTGQIQYG